MGQSGETVYYVFCTSNEEVDLVSESHLGESKHSIIKKIYLPTLITALVLILTGVSFAFYKHFEKIVSIRVDGKTRVVRTFSDTISDVLSEDSIKLGPADRIVPNLSTKLEDNLKIKIIRAFPVTIAVDGKTMKVLTTKTTVDAVLSDNKVDLSKQDKVFPPIDSKVRNGSFVRVMRINQQIQKKLVAIPFKTSRVSDKKLDIGKVKVIAVGTEGVLQQTYKVTVADGKVVARTLVGTRTLKAPTPKVVSVGTRIPMGVLVTSRGTYRYRRVHSMTATAYSSRGRRAATGMAAIRGVVAVDPRVIPLHSRVYVEGYGHAVAGDTGGSIKGNRVDLCFNSHGEALSFGRRRVKVYILE
jgi:uncharacterized protein YabE (DUF348 family)